MDDGSQSGGGSVADVACPPAGSVCLARGNGLPPSPFASTSRPGSPAAAAAAPLPAAPAPTAVAASSSRPFSAAADRPPSPRRPGSPRRRQPFQRPTSAASHHSMGRASEASISSRSSMLLADVLSSMSLALPAAPSEVSACGGSASKAPARPALPPHSSHTPAPAGAALADPRPTRACRSAWSCPGWTSETTALTRLLAEGPRVSARAAAAVPCCAAAAVGAAGPVLGPRHCCWLPAYHANWC